MVTRKHMRFVFLHENTRKSRLSCSWFVLYLLRLLVRIKTEILKTYFICILVGAMKLSAQAINFNDTLSWLRALEAPA